MRQKWRISSGATLMPRAGRSVFKKWRTKPSFTIFIQRQALKHPCILNTCYSKAKVLMWIGSVFQRACGEVVGQSVPHLVTVPLQQISSHLRMRAALTKNIFGAACWIRPGSLSDLGRRKRKSAPARIVFDDFASQYLDIG